MAQTLTEPRRRPPRIVYKVLNPLFVALLHTPLHGLMSRRLLALSFQGRKSGKRYRIPVGYAQTEDGLLITTQSRWAQNLRGGAPVSVRLRGQERRGTADLITDEAGMLAAYRVMLAQGPQLGEIIGVGLDASGEPRHEDVTRARSEGYVIIQITLS